MSAHVVWIDSQEAKIYSLTPGKVSTQTVRAKHPHPHGADPKHQDAEKLFHEVAGVLRGATEVLIVGPGEAKTHLKKHFETHHHGDLAKHVVGVETMDHPTDNQVLAHARKFFKTRDLFAGI